MKEQLQRSIGKPMTFMIAKSRVVLNPKFWEKAQSKKELKQLISNYMTVAYPDYRVIEVHKYYAICEIKR